MLLIAIDTSGRHGSVALCRAEQDSFETLEMVPLEGGTYSARLLPAIAEILLKRQIQKSETDAFVVISGPGSFTGLRVGISTAKGLAEVLQKPLVALSMLETIAVTRGMPESSDGTVTGHGFGGAEPGAGVLKGHGFSRAGSELSQTALAQEENSSNIIVALDAGRGEVYVGNYRIEPSRACPLREYIAKLNLFITEAASSGQTVLTPDAKPAEALSAAGARVHRIEPLRADDIGRFGFVKLMAGEVADPETLDANYIRRSDAEIFGPSK